MLSSTVRFSDSKLYSCSFCLLKNLVNKYLYYILQCGKQNLYQGAVLNVSNIWNRVFSFGIMKEIVLNPKMPLPFLCFEFWLPRHKAWKKRALFCFYLIALYCRKQLRGRTYSAFSLPTRSVSWDPDKRSYFIFLCRVLITALRNTATEPIRERCGGVAFSVIICIPLFCCLQAFSPVYEARQGNSLERVPGEPVPTRLIYSPLLLNRKYLSRIHTWYFWENVPYI